MAEFGRRHQPDRPAPNTGAIRRRTRTSCRTDAHKCCRRPIVRYGLYMELSFCTPGIALGAYRLSTIRRIDQLLTQHYGLTDVELVFIVNYDIKYRMGKGADETNSCE